MKPHPLGPISYVLELRDGRWTLITFVTRGKRTLTAYPHFTTEGACKGNMTMAPIGPELRGNARAGHLQLLCQACLGKVDHQLRILSGASSLAWTILLGNADKSSGAA